MVTNPEDGGAGSDFDVEHLATTIHPVIEIDVMRAEWGAVGRVNGVLRGLESVGGATVGATTFGLFAFRISHDEWDLAGVSAGRVATGFEC